MALSSKENKDLANLTKSARSAKIIIANNTPINLIMKKCELKNGNWVVKPQERIKSLQKIVFASESTGLMSGTTGYVTYVVDDPNVEIASTLISSPLSADSGRNSIKRKSIEVKSTELKNSIGSDRSPNSPRFESFIFEWDNPYFGASSVSRGSPPDFVVKCEHTTEKNIIANFSINRKFDVADTEILKNDITEINTKLEQYHKQKSTLQSMRDVYLKNGDPVSAEVIAPQMKDVLSNIDRLRDLLKRIDNHLKSLEPTLLQARAIHDYHGKANELSFEKGDIITILSQDSEEWWQGECDNKFGHFPANYCEIITKKQPLSSSTKEKRKSLVAAISKLLHAEALFTYVAQKDGELSVKKGDIVEIEIGNDNEDWIYCNKDGNWGYLPKDYLQINYQQQQQQQQQESPTTSPSNLIPHSSSSQESDSSGTPETPFTVQVKHSFKGDKQKNQMEIEKGMILIITSTSFSKNWWEAEYLGKKGYVPKNYLKIAHSSSTPVTPVESPSITTMIDSGDKLEIEKKIHSVNSNYETEIHKLKSELNAVKSLYETEIENLQNELSHVKKERDEAVKLNEKMKEDFKEISQEIYAMKESRSKDQQQFKEMIQSELDKRDRIIIELISNMKNELSVSLETLSSKLDNKFIIRQVTPDGKPRPLPDPLK